MKLSQERLTHVSPIQGRFHFQLFPIWWNPISWGTFVLRVRRDEQKPALCDACHDVISKTVWNRHTQEFRHVGIWMGIASLNNPPEICLELPEKHTRLSQEVAHTQVTTRPSSLWMRLPTSLLVYLGPSGSMMQEVVIHFNPPNVKRIMGPRGNFLSIMGDAVSKKKCIL